MTIDELRNEADKYFKSVLEQAKAVLPLVPPPIDSQKDGRYLSLATVSRIESGQDGIRDLESRGHYLTRFMGQALSHFVERVEREGALSDADQEQGMAVIVQMSSNCLKDILELARIREQNMLHEASKRIDDCSGDA